MVKTYAWLCLTKNCNNSCSWCYEKHLQSAKTQMDISDALANVELLASYGVKTLTLVGGEPTEYPWLKEVAARAKELEMFVGIVTNARNLSDPPSVDLLEKIDLIAPTIFSINPETHDEIAGAEGALEETLEGVIAAAKMGKHVTYNLVVGKQNQAEVFESIHNLIPGPTVILSSAFPRVCDLLEPKDGTYSLHPKDFAKIIEQCVDEFGTDNDILYTYESPLCFMRQDIHETLHKERRIITGCKVGRERMVISVDGTITACPALPIKVSDSINEDSDFFTKWKAKVSQTRRKLLSDRKVCKGCTLYRQCSGGCPNTWNYWKLAEEVQPIF